MRYTSNGIESIQPYEALPNQKAQSQTQAKQTQTEQTQVEQTLVCATFKQYADKPISILAVLSKDGIIIADHEPALNFAKPDFVNIADYVCFDGLDMIFKPEQLRKSIDIYRQLKSSRLIEYDTSMLRHDVNSSIQTTGLKDSGRFDYEVANLTNGQAAVLAICLLYSSMNLADSCIAMTNRIMGLQNSITI